MPIIRHSVNDSIPNFVEYNYPDFVELVELYYKHLFEQTDAGYILDAHKYIQADDSIDNYIAMLQDELGIHIPIHESITNKSLITHYLNVILSKRGTEAAIKAFFKLSFNEDVIISYPYRLLFIPSITQHDTLHSCLLSSTVKPNGNYYTLQGYSSGLVGSVETISYFEKDSLYYIYVEFHSTETLKLDERVDLIGAETIVCVNEGVHVPKVNNVGKLFVTGDIISFTNCVVQGEFEVVQLVKDSVSVTVSAGGIGYKVGELILSNPNNGFFAKVHKVTAQGTIQEVRVYNGGNGFVDTPELKIYTVNGTGAVIHAFTKSGGGVNKIKVKQPALLPYSTEYKAYTANGVMLDVELDRVPQTAHSNFLNNDHKTAINNFILDSNNTHNHSYNIITSLDIKYWKAYVDKYFHRSGYVYSHINPITVTSTVNASVNSSIIVSTDASVNPTIIKTQAIINGSYTNAGNAITHPESVPVMYHSIKGHNASGFVYTTVQPVPLLNHTINGSTTSTFIE